MSDGITKDGQQYQRTRTTVSLKMDYCITEDGLYSISWRWTTVSWRCTKESPKMEYSTTKDGLQYHIRWICWKYCKSWLQYYQRQTTASPKIDYKITEDGLLNHIRWTTVSQKMDHSVTDHWRYWRLQYHWRWTTVSLKIDYTITKDWTTVW